MTRNQNDDDDTTASSSQERSATCAPWSDLDHNLLSLIMMRLGFGDYYSFRGVCKSWRSLAHSDEKRFMATKPPMTLRICWRTYKKVCYLEDFEGRKFKTILPSFGGGTCAGLSSGYLIFFNKDTHDFWLFNPITRDQLHFNDFPRDYYPAGTGIVKAILVFSPLIHRWVFVVAYRLNCEIWFCIAGERAWNHVPYTGSVMDLVFFKGKIYTLTDNILCELRLNPEPIKTYLETKNFPDPGFNIPELVSSCENLYVMDVAGKEKLHELDFSEMKWASHETRMDEYAIFLNNMNPGVVVIPEESLADPRSYGRYVDAGKYYGKNILFTANMWYFPRECMKVNRMDE